jgi:hypothetical protein
LIVRYALESDPNIKNVKNLVLISTPNKGTNLANPLFFNLIWGKDLNLLSKLLGVEKATISIIMAENAFYLDLINSYYYDITPSSSFLNTANSFERRSDIRYLVIGGTNSNIEEDITNKVISQIYPRTLAMTFYGDMDVSVLDEMPKGRKPIKTFLVPDSKMNSVYRFVKQELDQNNQIFFIYPLVEESETLDLKNATEMYEKLAHVFNDYKVGLLHGKLPSSEKNEIMDKFMKKEYNILVATSVVEVGIDVPDATVMVIEHPDRFGLSQLHQLRGRVGRGKKQSYCFLIIDKKINRETRQKLSAFSKTNDGFKVAEIDLQWRGPGKFFGVEQHGIPEFKFLDLIEDFSIISQSRKKVEQFLVNPDDLKNLERLKSELKIRYGNSIELIHVL